MANKSSGRRCIGKTFWLIVLLLPSVLAGQAHNVDLKQDSDVVLDVLLKGFKAVEMVIPGSNRKVLVIKVEEGESLNAEVDVYNANNILVIGPHGTWVEGQRIESFGNIIFTHGGLAYFFSPQNGFWISDAKGSSKEFINAFSMRASGLLLPGQTGYTVWGVVLSKYKEYLSARGWSMEAARNELGFIQSTINSALNGMGDFALLNDDGSIKDNAANRIAIFFSGGRVGTFTVTGQIDPVTKKGYNWAQVPGGNIYAGLGGDMVDIKTLLADANYKVLALAILNNKTLSVEKVVREAGSWLLQQGQLNGVAEEIRKFL